LDKILIIDDELSICYSLEFALEEEYEVMIATNPEEALALLNTNDIRIILLDLKLGKYSGMDLLRQIKRDYGNISIIIMTAYASIETTVEAIKEGAYYYLKKPINIDELKLLLDKVVEYQRLNEKVKYLDRELKGKYTLGNFIGKSPKILKIFDLIDKIKDIDSSVLITGESGTGKELIAKAIHYLGNRAKNRFEVVNCAAIPINLLESELFGYEKGAFTGATSRKLGKFELADKGTIFLDEIGDMSYDLQSKLLRVLQNKSISPLGSNEVRNIDVRVIAATNKDIEEEIENKTFRDDLYYRLNVIQIKLPPLRERKEDIPLLVNHFINKYCIAFNKPTKEIDSYALEILENYNYKGNVRELENIIERAVALNTGNKITSVDLPSNIKDQDDTKDSDILTICPGETMKDIERKVIIHALKSNKGNKKRTANILDISERTLYYKIKEYGILE